MNYNANMSYCTTGMYDVYLFDILFTWFLLTQILMINKLFTKGHKIFLERMTNHLEIKNILSWKFLKSWRKIPNSLELSFSCQKKLLAGSGITQKN